MDYSFISEIIAIAMRATVRSEPLSISYHETVRTISVERTEYGSLRVTVNGSWIYYF